MGAATFTPLSQGAHGVTSDGKRWVEGSLALSASYATGGDSLAMTSVPGIKKLDRIEFISPRVNGTFYATQGLSIQLLGTATAPLLKAYCGTTASAAVEVANAVNLAARTVFTVRLVGT
jgi:hypothetical protein